MELIQWQRSECIVEQIPFCGKELGCAAHLKKKNPHDSTMSSLELSKCIYFRFIYSYIQSELFYMIVYSIVLS